jgi:hypothetical protein
MVFIILFIFIVLVVCKAHLIITLHVNLRYISIKLLLLLLSWFFVGNIHIQNISLEVVYHPLPGKGFGFPGGKEYFH